MLPRRRRKERGEWETCRKSVFTFRKASTDPADCTFIRIHDTMWVQWVLPELSAHVPVAISSDGKIKPGDARNVPIQMIFCMKVSHAGEGMLIARNAIKKRRVPPVGV